ncbi:MAG: LURP-one-related family protein [Clostridia bacterium]|nr:LURP-one-related family protein [Clostridia bacterium]
MKLIFKQRLFSWFDSYDIYNTFGEVVYTVKGQLAWGHTLKIFDSNGLEIATVKEKIFSWLPRFEMYFGDRYIGSISKEFTFFKPKFNIDFNGWHIEGNFFEWDYQILAANGYRIATVSKEIFKFTDTYTIDVCHERYALCALMLVIAIDAEKCSRN